MRMQTKPRSERSFDGGTKAPPYDVTVHTTKVVPFAITGKYTMFKKNVKIKFMPPMEIERGGLKVANQKLYQTVRNELEKYAEGVK